MSVSVAWIRGVISVICVISLDRPVHFHQPQRLEHFCVDLWDLKPTAILLYRLVVM
uniref:Uncharacterized protein n=1 Tax=Anguilla anguilla TaxID=7936 RepID=A0A0E9TC14_ANGAN